VISLGFFLFLAALTAIGFLEVVRRRREMPALLRGLLTIGAFAILVFVAWTLWAVLRH
jgi:hypothetical protein